MFRNALRVLVLLTLAFGTQPQPVRGEGLLVVVKNWIESAECARTTHAILVLCPGGKLIPIAAGSPGDDPGHALVLDVYAATTGKTVTTDTILKLNTVINFAGVAALAALLLCLRLHISALFVALAAPIISGQFNDISPHAAQLGDVCFAAILPISILGWPLAKSKQSIIWIMTGLVLLSLAATFRQSIGLMGLAATLISICISLRIERRALGIHSAVLLLAMLVYETPSAFLHMRDAAYGISSAGLMQRHGIWHNLYIGLGTDENPFGITWSDTSGFDAAQKVNPGVGWATQPYYDTIRGEYFKLVEAQPLDVANIYLTKLGDVLLSRLPDPVGSLVLLPTLLVIVGLFAVTGWKAGRQVSALQFICVLFVGFFMGQAVLFHYSWLYMHPMLIFLALAFGLCIDGEFAVTLQPRHKRAVCGEF